jgi:hypothetical protein
MTVFYYYRSLRGWAPCKAHEDALKTGSGTSKLDETHTKPITLSAEEEDLSINALVQKYPPPPEPV